MNNLLKTYKFSSFKVIKGRGCYLHTSDNKKSVSYTHLTLPTICSV